jgi:hypothetical protein
MTRIRPKLTFSNIVACLALFVALGGAAYAGGARLPKNSVGPKQLKKNSVGSAKIKPEAVTGAKVARDTITGQNVNEATLGQVPDAKALDGLGSSAFTRQAHAFNTEGFSVRETGGTPVQVDISAPQAGYLLAIGSGTVVGGPGTNVIYLCGFTVDNSPHEESWRFATISEGQKNDCSTNAVFPVSAGGHNVKLSFLTGSDSDKLGTEFTELDVVFIPLAG